jgi:7-carboxy-7-deazaguanine synthase
MRVDEIYLSSQGEGPRVGIPTVFTRFGGCNLRCPGWPCDTQHAIDPQYRKEWEKLEPTDVYERIEGVVGNRQDVTVCLTGGEPFLQKESELHELVDLASELHDVECFSNGTLPYPDWAIEKICFIMDWKLPGSGEDTFNEQRIQNLKNLQDKDAIKFVIKDKNDFDLAWRLYRDYVCHTPVEVYYGVAWDQITNATVVKWVLDSGLPWRHNVQVHNYIWDRRRRGI